MHDLSGKLFISIFVVIKELKQISEFTIFCDNAIVVVIFINIENTYYIWMRNMAQYFNLIKIFVQCLLISRNLFFINYFYSYLFTCIHFSCFIDASVKSFTYQLSQSIFLRNITRLYIQKAAHIYGQVLFVFYRTFESQRLQTVNFRRRRRIVN